jgi:hypothetical protein
MAFSAMKPKCLLEEFFNKISHQLDSVFELNIFRL